jgi:hypothetical protein
VARALIGLSLSSVALLIEFCYLLFCSTLLAPLPSMLDFVSRCSYPLQRLFLFSI